MHVSTPEIIREKLQGVLDPELFLSIVDLGLVYDIRIEKSGDTIETSTPEKTEKSAELQKTVVPEKHVSSENIETNKEASRNTAVILMTLTTIGCPLFDTIQNDIKKAVLVLPDIADVRVELTFDPPWEYSMMSESARAELGVD